MAPSVEGEKVPLRDIEPCLIQPSACLKKISRHNGAVECGDLIVTSGEGRPQATPRA